MISHLSLTQKKSISPSVNLQTDSNGFEFLIVEHEKISAALTLHGGHLIHFQRAQQEPLIWLSKTAVFDDKKAIRGGVPVCWPWFGAADASLGENLPGHGFARTSKWTLGKIEESAEGVDIELHLTSSEETLALWNHQFELTLKLSLNAQLKIDLITENKSDKPLNYKGALHTYLNISDPASVNVSGLNDECYNSLEDKRLETGKASRLVDQAIDAIHKKSDSNIILDDKGFQRTLTMTNTGNDSEVFWTPWVEGSIAFADVPDDGYKTMLCIESAITQGKGQTVDSGEKHTLTTLIK